MSLLPPPFTAVECRKLPSSSTATSFCSILQVKISSNVVSSSASKEVEDSPIKPRLPFSALTLRPLSVSTIISSIGDSSSLSTAIVAPSPPRFTQWNLDRRHILLLNFTACATAVSAAWLFFSAIPTLLAFKKAAESFEKLLDVTAEELPDTMAAVRLSGMEISDLTTELSDLGQEISQGVRSSTRAVRLAEERLRLLSPMNPTIMVQGRSPPRDESDAPVLAKSARNLREGIVSGRVAFGVIFSVTQFSRWAVNFLASRIGKKPS